MQMMMEEEMQKKATIKLYEDRQGVIQSAITSTLENDKAVEEVLSSKGNQAVGGWEISEGSVPSFVARAGPQDAGDNGPDGDDSERVGGSHYSGDEKVRCEGDNGRNKCNRKEAIKLFPSKEQ